MYDAAFWQLLINEYCIVLYHKSQPSAKTPRKTQKSTNVKSLTKIVWFQQFCGTGQDQRQRRCGRAERCRTRMWETSSFYSKIESNAYDAQCERGLTHSVHTDAGQSDIQHGRLATQFTVHETITFLLVTLPNIHRFRKKITHRLSNEPFFLNVSHGSAATHVRCRGIFNEYFAANLLKSK